jgi:uncharacterized protein
VPLRAVVDNNLFVSIALRPGATLRRLLEHWEQRHFSLLTSEPIRVELLAVLDRFRRQGQLPNDPSPILETLERRAEITAGAKLASGVCRDPDDDKFLSCAIEGQAGYLVSGDADLLDLSEYQGIRIVTPRQFVQLLDSLENEPTG